MTSTSLKAKIVAITILLLVAVGFASNRVSRTDGQSALPTNKEQTREVPTPIQAGLMTQAQKEHSKLFGEYKRDVTQGKTLHQLILEKGRDLQIERGIGNVRLPASFSVNDYLAKLSCEADAVVIGTEVDKSSNLVEDESFTFTEYQFAIEDVLKDNSKAPIKGTSTIKIVRASGAISMLGHNVRAIDHSQKPLAVNGRFLLFLRFVAGTGAYRSFGRAIADDSFQLDGNQITQVSDQPFPLGDNHSSSSDSFLKNARVASENACAK